MGQLIQKDHPLFKEFPTESHTNWQWWPMANQRAVILPDTVKQPFDAIITEMDSYAFLRPMAQLPRRKWKTSLFHTWTSGFAAVSRRKSAS